MHIFVSPHYDDAVYSCGGTMHQLAQRGEEVLMLTVMGGTPPDPPPDTPIVRDLHARWAAGTDPITTRLEEDRAAAAVLGAGRTNMSIPDCVYRTALDGTPLYPDEDSLWHRIHPDDPAPHKIANSLHAGGANATLYVQLGAGGHVDHLIVRNWAIAQVQAGASNILFYEDFPYSEDPGAVAAALAQFPAGVTLRPHAVLLTETDIAAKIEGVQAYRSQVSTFWQDDATLRERVRAALMRSGDTPAEHYHRAQVNP